MLDQYGNLLAIGDTVRVRSGYLFYLQTAHIIGFKRGWIVAQMNYEQHLIVVYLKPKRVRRVNASKYYFDVKEASK